MKPVEPTETKVVTSRSRVPLASVQERASQSLKMQPYALPAPSSLTRSEKRQLLKMSVQRILDAETLLEPTTVEASGADSGSTLARRPVLTWNNSTKTMWLLLVAKLVTRSTTIRQRKGSPKSGAMDVDDNYEAMDVDDKARITTEDDDSNADELKEMLLEFIVADLPLRCVWQRVHSDSAIIN